MNDISAILQPTDRVAEAIGGIRRQTIQEPQEALMNELHRHLVLLFLICCGEAILEQVDTTHEIGIVHGQMLETEALTTTKDGRELTRGQLDDLGDLDDSTYREEVAELGILDIGVTLGDDTEAALTYL